MTQSHSLQKVRKLFDINNVIDILFIKAEYESHQVNVFKYFTFIPKQ